MTKENKDKKQEDVKVGDAITTEVVINSLKIGKSSDTLLFTSLKADDYKKIGCFVENEEQVIVEIALLGKADPKFPPMAAHAIMTGYKINKNTDAPVFKGLKFSPGQHERISRLIEAEEIVMLSIQQIQKQLEFEGE